MTVRAAAPMPEELRHFMRAKQHPARVVDCPHCGAHANRPCLLRSNGRLLPQPHPQRVSAWAQLLACCPTCQVTPEVPCHANGMALPNGSVHAARYEEAEVTAA